MDQIREPPHSAPARTHIFAQHICSHSTRRRRRRPRLLTWRRVHAAACVCNTPTECSPAALLAGVLILLRRTLGSPHEKSFFLFFSSALVCRAISTRCVCEERALIFVCPTFCMHTHTRAHRRRIVFGQIAEYTARGPTDRPTGAAQTHGAISSLYLLNNAQQQQRRRPCETTFSGCALAALCLAIRPKDVGGRIPNYSAC